MSSFYPGRLERFTEWALWWRDRLVECHLLGRHVEKMDSRSRCYRCHKPLRQGAR